jgi:hypothetical protein
MWSLIAQCQAHRDMRDAGGHSRSGPCHPVELRRIRTCGGVHTVANLIDRFVSVLLTPPLEAFADHLEIARPVLEERRDHLHRVGAQHHGLHRIDWLMDASGNRERAAERW